MLRPLHWGVVAWLWVLAAVAPTQSDELFADPDSPGALAGLLLPPDHAAWQVPTAAESPGYRFWSLPELRANQFPPTCDGRRFLLKHMDTPGGMWAQIREVSGLLGLAMSINRTLVTSTNVRHPWRYSPPAVATDTSGTYRPWEYWFEPLTSCEVPNHARPEKFLKGCPSAGTSALVVEAPNRDCYKAYAHPYPANGHQVWRNALLGSFVFRPAPKVRAHALQLQESMGLQQFRPFISIHVRRTDKKAETGRYVPIQSYLDVLAQIAKESGLRRVYMATDDPQLVSSVQQYKEYQWLTVPTRPYSRPKVGSHDFLKKYVYLPHRFNATSHTLDFLSECIMLTQGEWFVGTVTSHVGMAIGDLMAAKHHNYTHYKTYLFDLNQKLCTGRVWFHKVPNRKFHRHC
uniref:Alpha-(1,6)-fucosyltransferase N- and catalytic domain-containing protein n=1 Tax=Eutreptiella gymnastica TaxID=73025 RepID=A0A7S1NHD7_9EUGL|mmetsp:Transcript_35468/g.63384  ORF Transcript_35468/g.63384 Transcript_35468/m.63384 type:complete len:403 (+) Transcript_35468:18-1226(+)